MIEALASCQNRINLEHFGGEEMKEMGQKDNIISALWFSDV